MTTIPKPRRPDTDRAFAHLGEYAATADVSGITDPLQQWVTVLRRIVSHYGHIGERPSVADIRFVPVSAGGVPAEWVIAEGASPRDRIVYVHGGGWAAGTVAEMRDFSGLLARLSGASVLSVDYRLAPEHQFPAGLEDSYRAYLWAAEHGPEAADSARTLSLIGDSAGGSLAAAVCALAMKAEARIPDRLALVAGTLDNLPKAERVGIDDLIGLPDSLAASIAVYLRPGDVPTDPRVSPVYEPDDVLSRFPPTLLQASSTETLLHDSKVFARRLEEAGARVTLSVWPGLPHVWHHFTGLFPEAQEATQEIADFLIPRSVR